MQSDLPSALLLALEDHRLEDRDIQQSLGHLDDGEQGTQVNLIKGVIED